MNNTVTYGGVKYLVAFTIAIIVVSASLSIFFAVLNDDGFHWMVPSAITVMVIFMPLTAISFLRYRLPQKQKEYQTILHTLGHYDTENQEADYVIEDEYKGSDYLLPIYFVVFFSFLGFYILFSSDGKVLLQAMTWVNDPEAIKTTIFRQNLVAIGFSFLGAYVWSIQYIFRRMVTFDLPPGAYYSVGTRLVFSSFIALVFSHFIANASYGLADKLPMIAFLAGIFPERLLTWMRDAGGNMFSRHKEYAADVPLEMIEGISSFQRTRLAELGIDNAQNLAHASLIELIIKTPYKPRVIADWMGQARLCLEFKANINAIRGAGVRTILDYQEVCSEEGLLEQVAVQSGLDISLLRAVERSNRNEVSIDHLRDAYDKLNTV